MRANQAKLVTPTVAPVESDEDLWFLANHDPLTGLFNRRRFVDELERELAASRRYKTEGALLLLDLDRFKDVNDTLGHPEGDRLLARVAKTLAARLRATDRLSRLGGDEFAVILPACDVEGAKQVARDLADAMASMPGVSLRGWERPVSFSAGVAMFDSEAKSTVESLLVEADIALYRAKGKGPASINVFDDRMREETDKRLRTEDELARAIERREFEVYYQPVVSLEGPAPVVCEALVRWHHPERGIVGPVEFIDAAERTGAIGAIDDFVLAEACAQAARWRKGGHHVGVSVNLSPGEIAAPGFAGRISSALERNHLPPGSLWLEITERELADSPGHLDDALTAVRELGVIVALDDFGTGTSSLSALRVLPLDVVKIDRLFVNGMSDDPAGRAIVTAVLSMASELGLRVVAEGVEQAREHWDLRELGCELAQGFLYARPSPPAEIELDGYSKTVQPGVGDPSVIREFMRQIGIPARIAGVIS